MSRRSSSVVQVVAIALGWVLFAGMWARVLAGTSPATIARTVALLVAGGTTFVVANALWVAHNRRIYRVKGPRRGMPTVEMFPTTDYLGRKIMLNPRASTSHPRVDIVIAGDHKLFVPSPGATPVPLARVFPRS